MQLDFAQASQICLLSTNLLFALNSSQVIALTSGGHVQTAWVLPSIYFIIVHIQLYYGHFWDSM